LFLEDIKDRIGAIAFIDLIGKRMAAEICPSFLGVLVQGSIEKGLEVGGRGGHIGS
jgi:hypothetical protein